MSSPAPKTVLVTGSMGFLGRHLVRRLLEDGHTVIGVDKDMDESEIQALEKDYLGRFHFAQADLLEDRTISRIFEDFKPNWCVHLAAMAQEPASRQFPELSSKINRDVALNFMKAAHEYWQGLGRQAREDFRAYFQSTDKVYRYDEIDGVATETSPYVTVDGPASPYAKHKAMVEQALMSPSGPFVKSGFPFQSGNLVNVIGPEDLKNKERLIQGAVHTWMRGGLYKVVKGNLDAKRQYISVSDASNAIVTILEKGAPQNKYNISNGVTLSNEAAIRIVQEAFQELIKEGKIPPVKTEYIATDDKSFRPGADEEDREEGLIADKLYALGYRPQHPDVEGIKLAIREMILAEWDAMQQERAVAVAPPGDLSPAAQRAAAQAGDAIARNAAQGEEGGYSLDYYEKSQPSVRLKIVVDGSSEHRRLNRAQEEILSRFKAGGVHPVSASHEVSKEDGAFRGRTEIKFFFEIPLSEIKQAEKLLDTWMGKKPAIGADVIEGLDAGNTEHSGPKPGIKRGKASRSL